MPTHITARLAWHSNGWNGAVCKNPAGNTYCVGSKSFPGDVIARERDLEKEQKLAGCAGEALKGYVPPCSYSYNAFGLEEAPAGANPPDFFFGGASRRDWTLAPATVSVWPYEAMYNEEVKAGGYLDNDKRRALTLEFFAPIQEDCGKNLIFYYANYSNPLSDETTPRYVLIGVSRVKAVGEELLYNKVSEKVAERYAGGIVWARDVTSNYPNEGLRLPYHRYMDDPQKLAEIAVFPENPIVCKYGSKHLSDDEAIGLLEQFLSKVRRLREIGDATENWEDRESWLLKTIAELWTHRGLYPGLLRVLEACGATALVDGTKLLSEREGHQAAHAKVFAVLENGETNELTDKISANDRKKLSRNWQLHDIGVRKLFRDVLPRFDLAAHVMSAIASEARSEVGLSVTAESIAENPYLISETYCGDDPSDRIAWSAVDRGVLPSPDLGGEHLADVDFNDARRFRALCVDQLKKEQSHTFRLSAELLSEISERMGRLPDWKQAQFTERYFSVDAEFLSETLTLKTEIPGIGVYLRTVHEDERKVEASLRELAGRPDIDLRRPVTESDWKSWIYKPDSLLAVKADNEYRPATEEQAKICGRLFSRPLSLVTGPAGTGKTTVIEALIRAIRRTEGEGADVLVLAPTGKAADRAREVLEKATLQSVKTGTIHSFLASQGWLNDNLTFKRKGGKATAIGTLILDEASMLDLELAAALFRAIDWRQVRRLILVGDAGQLPPIGRGRVFADLIKWLKSEQQESLGHLQRNLRQALNRAQNQGKAIVALSELFIVDDDDKSLVDDNGATTAEQESLIERIHSGGQVDRDLDVVYWARPSDLSQILIDAVEAKMSGGVSDANKKPHDMWREALKNDPTSFQILTPHRGELHGVEALNEVCQQRIAKFVIERLGAIDGVTLFDKVIQVRNRPKSDLIWAYDWDKRQSVQVEAFNGEIGTVSPIGFDAKDIYKTLKTGYGPRLKRFAVQFTRKPGISVGYGKNVPTGTKRPRSEKVEDNLELAYAVSIHKAQGSEFAHTFVVLPASSARPVSTELVYTALTRATGHCTLLIERDIRSLLDARRRENAQTPQINSSLFSLHLAKSQLVNRSGWYEAGKIHEALSGDMLRSKSEVIIANLLHQQEVPFSYELALFAGDGTLYLPDFTITWRGKTYYWEHLGLLDQTRYAEKWATKLAWYQRWFPGQLITTEEGAQLSRSAAELIQRIVTGELTQ
jgi:hypothetical protein